MQALCKDLNVNKCLQMDKELTFDELTHSPPSANKQNAIHSLCFIALLGCVSTRDTEEPIDQEAFLLSHWKDLTAFVMTGGGVFSCPSL